MPSTPLTSKRGSMPGAMLAGFTLVAVYNWYLWHRDRALAERLRSERTTTPALSSTPSVSVLVAAWNESEAIDAHLCSFLALRYPNIELIICAGGGDDTFERVSRYASERVVVLEQNPGEGKQRALARCFERASGEIIYLTDADCLYNDEALTRLLVPLIEEGEQAATGTSCPRDEQAGRLLPGHLWASDIAVTARSARYSSGLLGRNAAITRAAIEQCGGLDFPAPTGTDYRLARRLIRSGIAIRFVATSVIATEYPETLAAYRQQQSRWLRNLLLYGPASGATGDVRATLTTIAIGTLMLMLPLSAPLLGARMLVPWSLLFAHAVTSKLRYALFAARVCGRPLSPRVLASLIPLTAVDFVVWAAPTVDLINTKRRERW